MRIFFLFILLFTCVENVLYSQPQQGDFQKPTSTKPTGVIKGNLLDFKTKQPVEYASVTLFTEPDGKLISGAVTNEKGKFEISSVPFGNYFMTISFIGFTADTVRNLSLSKEKPELKLADIFLRPSEISINEVNVTGEKEILDYNLDKKVINVDKDITSTGANALEVMKNVPSVSVDIDGNVSLRGSNANILIDGKPSSMSASVLLEQLPAEMIDRIEIITNPSSRYDSEGMSGIINIVTKKNKKQGLNGVVNASVGTRHKYSAGINLNYRNKKVNYFFGADARYNQRFNRGKSFREYTVSDSLNYLNQEADGLRKGQNYNMKAGADIFLNDKTSLTLSGNIRYGLSDDEEDNDYLTTDFNDSISEQSLRASEEDEQDLNYDFAAGFKRTYEMKGKEWTMDASYSSNDSEEDMDALEQYSIYNYAPAQIPGSRQRTAQQEQTQVATVQTDYVLPVEKIGRFEFGAKGTYRNADNELIYQDFDEAAQDWVEDETRSNRFQFEETVIAGYVILGNKYKKLSYQAGVRYEGTLTDSYQFVTDEAYQNDYHKIFPSAHLRYALKKENEISLSYAKRISRPGMWSLNPFPEYSDPLNLRIGNPKLQPEIVHSFELGHQKVWKKISLTSTLFYRNTQDVIMRYTSVDSTGVATHTSLNLSESHSFGAEMVFNMNLFKWWRFNTNFSYFRQILEGREDLGISGSDIFNFNGRVSTTFTVWKNIDIQLSGFFRSKSLNAQGYTLPLYSFDMGLKKEILKGKGSISLSATDVFNTRRWRSVTEAEDYYVESMRRRESQILTLGFSYKINNGNTRKDKKRGEDGGGGMDMEMD